MRVLGAALAFLLACGGSNGDDLGDYDHLEVSPASAMLTVELGGSVQQPYVIYGVNGSSKKDITAQCGLDIDPEFGTFAGATVTVRAHGGKTTVNATCGPLTGTGALAVNLKGSVVVGMNTPPNAPDVFDNATATTDASRTPAIEYPLDRAVSPRRSSFSGPRAAMICFTSRCGHRLPKSICTRAISRR
jgi:hypothetical protein